MTIRGLIHAAAKRLFTVFALAIALGASCVIGAEASRHAGAAARLLPDAAGTEGGGTTLPATPDGIAATGYLAVTPVDAGAATGPTPFPRDERDWPGTGVIRVFDFMNQNRAYFWSRRAANQGAVVFTGDSLIGNWTSPADDFAPLHVANIGIGGDVTRGLLFRLPEDIIALKPRAVVILIGTNDLSAGESVPTLMSNMTSILRKLRDSSASLPVVLCTIPPRDYAPAPVPAGEIAELNARLAALARSDGRIVIFDLNRQLALPDGTPDRRYFQADGLHLSAAGYRRFHDTLEPVLRGLKLE